LSGEPSRSRAGEYRSLRPACADCDWRLLCAHGVCAGIVAPRSAVPADHIDFPTGVAKRAGQVIEQIKHSGIETLYVSGAMVAKVVIKPVESFWDVTIAAAINDIEPLACVRVVETQPILTRTLVCRLGSVAKRRQQQRHN